MYLYYKSSLELFFCALNQVQIFVSGICYKFIADVKAKTGFEAKVLDLGGGYGVRYVESDPTINIEDNIRQVAEYVKAECENLGITYPEIHMEPGRSIVADAGMTLYTAGTVKQITGYKNYLSVNGGMTDNPRYALYGSAYTVYIANKMGQSADFSCDLVGRCCESGDVIQPGIQVPMPERGDIVAVCTTGAYNYSMASNYNRIPRPALVMLSGGESYVAVRRETLEDLMMNDL